MASAVPGPLGLAEVRPQGEGGSWGGVRSSASSRAVPFSVQLEGVAV